MLDDDSDTATEGEEEIQARERRKMEVQVKPPIVHTDTGTDTEVKTSTNSHTETPEQPAPLDPLPDLGLPKVEILPGLDVPAPRKNSKSSDDVSLNSNDFDSAESDFEDCVREFETESKNLETHCLKRFNDSNNNKNTISKSATVGAIVKRNFTLPPKAENRKSFGKEFIPAFKTNDSEPLLIIKRTPSKIHLPKEVGKPKVAVKTNIDSAKKYFGDVKPKTIKTVVKPKVEEAPPLPPKEVVKPIEKEKTPPCENKESKEKENSAFNFDPHSDDDLDNYIEDLLQNEEELMKPIDPNKFALPEPEPESEPELDKESVSSSIEDLLKALETENSLDDSESAIELNPDEKIEDLLEWMNNLDHSTHSTKLSRSLTDVKYKNLERVLKTPQRADSIISKLPKDNIKYFEMHLSGKQVPQVMEENFALTRSKTDVLCNQHRKSVDLDAMGKVDVKKVLRKFESFDSPEPKKEPLVSRRSFGKRSSCGSFNFKKAKELELKDIDGESSSNANFYKSNCTVQTKINPNYYQLGEDEGTVVSANLVLNVMNDLNKEKSKEDELVNDLPNIVSSEPEQEKIDEDKKRERSASVEAEISDMLEGFDSLSKGIEKELKSADENKKEFENIVQRISDLQSKLGSKQKSPEKRLMGIITPSGPSNEIVPEQKPPNLDDLYAKVNKKQKELPIEPPNEPVKEEPVEKSKETSSKIFTYSPPVPRRIRKHSGSEVEPPPRPQRQKSFEQKQEQRSLALPKPNPALMIRSADNSPIAKRKVCEIPVVPTRKKCLTASPPAMRKHPPQDHKIADFPVLPPRTKSKGESDKSGEHSKSSTLDNKDRKKDTKHDKHDKHDKKDKDCCIQ